MLHRIILSQSGCFSFKFMRPFCSKSVSSSGHVNCDAFTCRENFIILYLYKYTYKFCLRNVVLLMACCLGSFHDRTLLVDLFS